MILFKYLFYLFKNNMNESLVSGFSPALLAKCAKYNVSNVLLKCDGAHSPPKGQKYSVLKQRLSNAFFAAFRTWCLVFTVAPSSST